jgi:hypothetical protein
LHFFAVDQQCLFPGGAQDLRAGFGQICFFSRQNQKLPFPQEKKAAKAYLSGFPGPAKRQTGEIARHYCGYCGAHDGLSSPDFDGIISERDEEKWEPVFRPHPALIYKNRSRS